MQRLTSHACLSSCPGDGARFLRWLMVNLPFLHTAGAMHYALEAMTMLVAMTVRLPSRLAIQTIQACFFGDGTTCHATDLHVEHIIKDIKAIMTRIGTDPKDMADLTKFVCLFVCCRFVSSHVGLLHGKRLTPRWVGAWFVFIPVESSAKRLWKTLRAKPSASSAGKCAALPTPRKALSRYGCLAPLATLPCH